MSERLREAKWQPVRFLNTHSWFSVMPLHAVGFWLCANHARVPSHLPCRRDPGEKMAPTARKAMGLMLIVDPDTARTVNNLLNESLMIKLLLTFENNWKLDCLISDLYLLCTK